MKNLLLLALLQIAAINLAFGHCQVPCGIFSDETRFDVLLEHVSTIRKASAQIEKLSAAEKPNLNQVARWVSTKESHAVEIQHIIADYFLAQRVKEGQDHYKDKLVVLHKIIVSAMKSKQSVDSKPIDALEKSILEFKELYLHHKH